MSLVAHLEPERAKSERRSSRRRKLWLELKRQVPAESRVIIHDLSEQGMLLEGDADLAAGETFDLVIASVHSNLKMTEEKAMMRVMRTIENPYTIEV